VENVEQLKYLQLLKKDSICGVRSLYFCLLFFLRSLVLPISAAPAMCQQPRSALICEYKRNFHDMTPCQLENIHRQLEGTRCLYLQVLKQCLSLGLFNPEYGGSKLPRKTYRWREE